MMPWNTTVPEPAPRPVIVPAPTLIVPARVGDGAKKIARKVPIRLTPVAPPRDAKFRLISVSPALESIDGSAHWLDPPWIDVRIARQRVPRQCGVTRKRQATKGIVKKILEDSKKFS